MAHGEGSEDARRRNHEEERGTDQKIRRLAATLLQVPQLGILAMTLMRAGRRQALYYVSDEQLAKQTLAPLLLRDEAASLELKVGFDPAWSGYFEYAGYLS